MSTSKAASTQSCLLGIRNERVPCGTSFQLIPVFVRKVCFRLIAGLQRFVSSMTITQSMSLFGRHNARVLRPAVVQRVQCLTINSACQKSTSSVRGIENCVRESKNVLRDTRYSLLGTKYFLREAVTVLRDTKHSLLGTKYFLWEAISNNCPLGRETLPFENEIFLSGK